MAHADALSSLGVRSAGTGKGKNLERLSTREARDGFIPALEAARGLAALIVALMHVSQAKYALPDGQLVALLHSDRSRFGVVFNAIVNGHGAVIFFFVLSGFVLSLALKRQPDAPIAFAISRLFRIYPAVISTILLFVVVYFTFGGALVAPRSISHVIENMALIRADMNGVMWSLQLEVLAIPVILLSFYARSKFGALILPTLFVALVALSFSKQWTALLNYDPPLTAMHAFIAGMLAALYCETLVRKIGWSRVLLSIYVGGFFLARPIFGWFSNWSVVLETLFACGIVAQLAFGPFPKHSIPLLSYYGRISYSFYLLHTLSLIVLWHSEARFGAWVQQGVPRIVITLGIFVISVAVITVLAHIQQMCVEKPAMRLGNALVGRWRRPVTREMSSKTPARAS